MPPSVALMSPPWRDSRPVVSRRAETIRIVLSLTSAGGPAVYSHVCLAGPESPVWAPGLMSQSALSKTDTKISIVSGKLPEHAPGLDRPGRTPGGAPRHCAGLRRLVAVLHHCLVVFVPNGIKFTNPRAAFILWLHKCNDDAVLQRDPRPGPRCRDDEQAPCAAPKPAGPCRLWLKEIKRIVSGFLMDAASPHEDCNGRDGAWFRTPVSPQESRGRTP